MFSLDCLIKKKKKNTNMFFRNEKEEKDKTGQKQMKGFQDRTFRVSNSQYITQIASHSLTQFGVSGFYDRNHSES